MFTVKFLGVLFLMLHSGWTLPVKSPTNNGLHIRSRLIHPILDDDQGYVVRVQKLHSTRPFISPRNLEGVKISPFRLIHSNIGAPNEVVTESSGITKNIENTLESPAAVEDKSVSSQKEVDESVNSLITLMTLLNSLIEQLTGVSYLKDNILKENGISTKRTESSFSVNNDDNKLILTSESISDPKSNHLRQIKQAIAVLSDDKLEIIEKSGIIYENDTMKYDQTIIDVEKSSVTYSEKEPNYLDKLGESGNGGRINNVDENGHSTDQIVTLNDLPNSLKKSPNEGLEQVKLSKVEESKDYSPIGHSKDQLVKVNDPKGLVGQLPDSSNDKRRKFGFISVPKPLKFL